MNRILTVKYVLFIYFLMMSVVTGILCSDAMECVFGGYESMWRQCDRCSCCYYDDKTIVRCGGSDVTSINMTLPVNVTHL